MGALGVSKIISKENVTILAAKINWMLRCLVFLFRFGLVFLFHSGIVRPIIIWHGFAGLLRYFLVKHGVPSGTAKHLAKIHAEFEEQAAQGQFKELYFDMTDRNIVVWSDTFSRVFDRKKPVRILEIGAWEGRSTLFLLTYFTQGHLTAVDTWAGSDEHQHNAPSDLRSLEARFDSNLTPCAARLTKRKGSSLHVLPQLLEEEQKFDVIYVDGSHFGDDVLADGITAWRLLEKGGILIFDDFLWPGYPRARANPAWAINLFLKYHAGEYKILNISYQVILQKKLVFNDRVITSLATGQYNDRRRFTKEFINNLNSTSQVMSGKFDH
ncbi:class I SAM-dependent methyltransferase [Mycobacterium lepromatosis]|uniref:Class I SAM-dependent methyltransferase n=1 Tax=Mycobacterium lepromatosis TaxID=480418 RepID=A0A0F4ENY7_9MYCO|nr:class I SAM-dependent methyltransferase [Mycobacterium lepromatosis]KJX74681.1 hypothetical protein MLPM_2347 [Mycobacterium lepromatosis]UKN42843.1 hypothetical protein MLPF_2689 [Mycobacterium lepromatosis]